MGFSIHYLFLKFNPDSFSLMASLGWGLQEDEETQFPPDVRQLCIPLAMKELAN